MVKAIDSILKKKEVGGHTLKTRIVLFQAIDKYRDVYHMSVVSFAGSNYLRWTDIPNSPFCTTACNNVMDDGFLFN